MKKFLMLASVASMIDQFNMSNIKVLQELGFEVHVAANFAEGNTCSLQRLEEFKQELNGLGIRYYHVAISRNIRRVFANIKAYHQLKALMLENHYQIVHCHSPIGGVLGRLAARCLKTTVIYTAHGFHFYQGAPLRNWLIYYPVERLLAQYTDVLITINKEDFYRAKRFKAKKIAYIPGVGLDTRKISSSIVRAVKRAELGIPDGTIALLSVGELIKRKNHEIIIKALAKLSNPRIKYLICGQGELDSYLKRMARKLRVDVRCLGFRKDVADIYAAADIFVFPSKQEGLPLALLEAMSAGLPVVCSKIRGNTDLIENGKGGYLVEPSNLEGFAEAIEKVIKGRKGMSRVNLRLMQQFDLANVEKEMKSIYAGKQTHLGLNRSCLSKKVTV